MHAEDGRLRFVVPGPPTVTTGEDGNTRGGETLWSSLSPGPAGSSFRPIVAGD
jgi:hypothetical protein